jgi:hypothetical protein
MDSPKNYCTPAQVYLVFSIILLIVSSFQVKPSILSVVIHSLFIIFWTLLLNFICSQGYTGVSWFILLFPFIIIVFYILLGIGIDISKSS